MLLLKLWDTPSEKSKTFRCMFMSGKSINVIKNNTDLFLQASTETDVKVNTDRRMVKKSL